jgi:hypothetical protein
MTGQAPPTARALLLTRRGLLFASSDGEVLPENLIRGLELDLSALGYVLSARLRARLARTTMDEAVELRRWALSVLLAHAGADHKHEPLFRRFPRDIPEDTSALWWRKVLVHFLGAEGQPCPTCRRTGTTHVLDPCEHVVCERCFDGANYSACPVCEHHVDRSSPFFRKSPDAGPPTERVTFKLLDLGGDETDETRALFTSLCLRTQALSPADRDALVALVAERKRDVLAWLPPEIPVRENVAVVFGTLFRTFQTVDVLPHARRFFKSATDVLRFVAVLSGTDGSLMRETVMRPLTTVEPPAPLWRRIARYLGVAEPSAVARTVYVRARLNRFKVAKLPRMLRRALLAVLEGFERDRLVEDMRRHRSYWVWVGEFLHPHEYASRYPKVARAFGILRERAPDGTPAPRFRTWYGKLDQAVRAKDATAMLALLEERPGELARRLDHALRVAGDGPVRERLLAAFVARTAAFATPVLVTLRSHLPTRAARAPVRVYWPKGRVAVGVSGPDGRAPLPPRAIEPAVRAIDAELLRRFAAKPAFDACVIDDALRGVMVPFNERTASTMAVALPRGSRVKIPAQKFARLFLHWCQPAANGRTTDLDLSVGLYDASWRPVAVCSYYELTAMAPDGRMIAKSAGDLRDAPFPDGATEFVDVYRDVAAASNVRYAVMVVNNYGGMPFSLLERGFAGIMLREDASGAHFDPRTVEWRFALTGENGVFLPLVFDFEEGVLHGLDVHSKGRLDMNNVETSNSAITKICPELIGYFASGVRPTMWGLGLLHAAARCRRVYVRGDETVRFDRRAGEDAAAFHARLVGGESDVSGAPLPPAEGPPVLALLLHGDVDLPEGSSAYALFREQVVPTLTASDLLS